jgi:hypothetical protein
VTCADGSIMDLFYDDQTFSGQPKIGRDPHQGETSVRFSDSQLTCCLLIASSCGCLDQCYTRQSVSTFWMYKHHILRGPVQMTVGVGRSFRRRITGSQGYLAIEKRLVGRVV